MEPSLILFLIMLLALAFFMWSNWTLRNRNRETIAEMEARPVPGDTGEDTFKTALARISEYLRHSVAAPLQEGLERGGAELAERADEALGAVEDMEFFVEERDLDLETVDVRAALQEVAGEYMNEFDIVVKLRAPDAAVHARLAPEAFKDAIYLLLVNAGRFGRGNPVEVTLETRGGATAVRVRDHGSGFSEEALARGAEPFYTTEKGALGMGLAHAARLVRQQGGELRLGNSPRGGGEVEVRLPES
jgi:signal transduction histidine kinase